MAEPTKEDVIASAQQTLADVEAKIKGLDLSISALKSSGNEVGLGHLNEELEKAIKSQKELSLAIKGANSTDNFGDLQKKIDGVKNSTSGTGTVFKAAGQKIAGMVKSMMSDSSPLLQLIGTSLPLAMAKFREDAAKKIDAKTGLYSMQKEIMDFNKGVITAGMGFGASFANATADLDMYKNKFIETMQFTKSSKDDILKVSNAFKQGSVSLLDQTRSMDGLRSATEAMKASMTLTNVAQTQQRLLVGWQTPSLIWAQAERMLQNLLEQLNGPPKIQGLSLALLANQYNPPRTR
jgi:hypothetical protein